MSEREGAVDVAAIAAYVTILAILAHSTLRFMNLETGSTFWALILASALLTALLARWRNGGFLATALLATMTLWSLVALRLWPGSLETVSTFIARWLVFLIEAYWGTLVEVPADVGQFTIAFLIVALAWGGGSLLERAPAWAVLLPSFGYVFFLWYFNFDDALLYLQLLLVPASLLLTFIAGKQWYSRRADRVIEGFPIRTSLWSVTTFVLVVILLATAVPLEGDTWNLSTVREWLNERFPALERMRGGPERDSGINWFTLSTSGFGSTSRLGGPVTLDTSDAFDVEIRAVVRGEEDLPFPVYFRGRTMTRYTGRGWEAPARDDWEWYEFGKWLPRTHSPRIASMRVIQEIAPTGLEIHTMFGVGDVREIDFPDAENDYEGREVLGKNSRGDVMANVSRPVSERYRVLSQLPFWQMGSGEPPLEPEPLEDPEEYLKLPEDLPDRIGELAVELSSGADSEYEMAAAITEHLRDIPYSLEVAPPPGETDFVDYFLFEENAGYCTYHSTALAVMLRTLDIPSRWVQGFIASRDDFERSEEESSEIVRYRGEVTHATAHAWIEAWIPGYGWVPFEATPAYNAVDHTRILPEDSSGSEGTIGSDVDPDDERWPFEEDMGEEFPDDGAEEGSATAPHEPWWAVLLRVFGYGAATILAGGAVGLHYASVRREKKVGERSVTSILGETPARDTEDYDDTFGVLSAMDLALYYLNRTLAFSSRGLTGREFAARVHQESGELGRIVDEINENYEKVVYAGEHPRPKQARRTRKLVGELKKIIRRDYGLIRYLLTRYAPPRAVDGENRGPD